MLFSNLKIKINKVSYTQSIVKMAVLCFAILFSILIFSNFSHAAINKQISYQGKLTDAANVAVVNGDYSMIISLYTAATGGTPVWTAQGPVGAPTARTVTVANGIFSIMLGDTVAGDNAIALDFNSTYYLGIQVGTDAEMSPRRILGAAPYAFNSDLLDGLDSATSGATAHILATDASGNITITGGVVSILATGTAPFTIASTTVNTNLNADLLDGQHESAFALLAGRSGGQTLIGGSAVTDILKLQGTSGNGTATASAIQLLVGNNGATVGLTILNSGNVGIGTTNPLAKLQVTGAPRVGGEPTARGDIVIDQYLTGATTAGGLEFKTDFNGSGYGSRILDVFDSSSAYDLQFQNRTNSASWTTGMTLKSGGNIGIGTTNPTKLLTVNGDITTSASGVIYANDFEGISGNAYFNYSAPADTFLGKVGALNIVGSGSVSNTLNIKSGNVGIGTTNPLELLTLGTAGTTAGTLSLAGATSGKAILQVSAVAGTPTLTLPTTTGTLALLSDLTSGYIPYTGGTTNVDLGLHDLTVDINTLFVDSATHRIGIGTLAPSAKLDIYGTDNALRLSYDDSNYATLTSSAAGDLNFTSSATTESAMIIGNNTAQDVSLILDNLTQDFYAGIDNTDSVFKIGTGQTIGTNSILAIKNNGYVGIGTANPLAALQIGDGSTQSNMIVAKGYLCVDDNNSCSGTNTVGGIYSVVAATTGADYAEYFETKDTDLQPGEAVCVDVTKSNSVKRCDRTGDNDVMGIVSSHPSIIGNNAAGRESDSNYKVIAMMGQVSANISTENGAVQIGDNLTSASKAGYLRKANAGESTVGVAMQNFSADNGAIQVLISRRNQSLTVENVEQQVAQNISAMGVQDQVNNMISAAQSALTQQLGEQTQSIASLQDTLTTQTTLTATLQAQMKQLQDQLGTSDLVLINDKLDTLLGFLNAVDGDISVAGKLTSKISETGQLIITVKDPEAATIGEAVICPAGKGIDVNLHTGEDNYNKCILDNPDANGKSVEVKTTVVTANSKIFVTAKTISSQPLAVSAIKNGTGFTVETKDTVSEDLQFDWWIVEAK